MKGIKVIGTGYYVPKRRVTNDEFTKIVDTSDEWIQTRTGIRARHFVSGETTTDLAFQAAKRAIQNVNVHDIGVVIVASMTNSYITPSTAALLQKRLHLDENIIAFDLSAACSGFEYALETARSLLMNNDKPYALVVGAETLSTILDFSDRSTCVLFGDGAGAVVISLDDALYAHMTGVIGDEEALYVRRDEQIMHMNGRKVFRFATQAIEKCITTLLKKTKLSTDDIDYFVVHQANGRIISHVYRKLKCDPKKFYINLDEYGNTSGASVPLALSEMNEKGMLKKGMKIMLIGFGGGLTYGANLFEW